MYGVKCQRINLLHKLPKILNIGYAWLRLAIFLHGPLKETLLHVLHNKSKDVTYNGLPEDPSALYTQLLTTHQNTINSLVKKNVLKKDQLELLLPTNGHKKTYSNTFDITLLVVLIINCTTLPPPVNGWNQKIPLHNDFSVAANRVACKRMEKLFEPY